MVPAQAHFASAFACRNWQDAFVTTRAYTDGACSGNPGPGGWAFVVDDGPWASGAEAMTTNQRMEITAAFEAVRRVSGPLEIVSDSTYVVNCFVQRWWEGWLKRGWKNSNRQPVANRIRRGAAPVVERAVVIVHRRIAPGGFGVAGEDQAQGHLWNCLM